jgi:hypothetical protein
MNTNLRLLSSYGIYILAVMLRKSIGEHKLPEFIKLWYSAGYYEGLDACGVTAYNYINVKNTPIEIFTSCTPDPGCSWDESSFQLNKTKGTQIPSGFISNNGNDWSQITLDPSNPIPGYYSINQTCNGVGSLARSGWVYPLYDCPENTRVSFDNVTHEIGCTTTPTPCLADIVGRDLGSDGGEFFGHVGLVATFGKANPNSNCSRPAALAAESSSELFLCQINSPASVI